MREAGKRAVAVAAAAVVVVAAGCGGGSSRLSKSDYEQKLKTEASTLRSQFAGLNLSQVSNLKILSDKLGTVRDRIEKAASDIEGLKPPQDAVTDNNKIADTLHKFAKVFGEMQDAAKKNQPAKVRSLVARLQAAAQEGSSATQDLKAKGYDIGQFGQ